MGNQVSPLAIASISNPNPLLDTLKGSYYANPTVDKPTVDDALRAQYPEYYSDNICTLSPAIPSPFLEIVIQGPTRTTSKALSTPSRISGGSSSKSDANSLKPASPLVSHSLKLSIHHTISPFPPAASHLSDASVSLHDLIATSQTTKARLLHYFPPTDPSQLASKDEPVDSWCGFHLDHSLLTGLCSALYLDHKNITDAGPATVSSPSEASGLYIRTRGGDLTKVTIPPDCLAFQTGEAFELATGGKLRATPREHTLTTPNPHHLH